MVLALINQLLYIRNSVTYSLFIIIMPQKCNRCELDIEPQNKPNEADFVECDQCHLSFTLIAQIFYLRKFVCLH